MRTNPSGCFIFGPPFLDGALLLEVPSFLLEFQSPLLVYRLFILPCSNSLMEF